MSENTNKNSKVLIADDNEFFSKVMSNELEMREFQVKTAKDGQEAIDIAKKFIPDVILLDLIMPVKDGFETLNEINSIKSLSNTKVIIFSNLGQTEDMEEAQRLGASEYIIKKDFSLSNIVKKVEDIISQ